MVEGIPMSRPRRNLEEIRTTVYIYKKNTVEQHMININEKQIKDYINRLIKEDILKNGDEYIIKKYFKGTDR